MNLLLDTHVLLWWMNGDKTLAREAAEAIADGNNMVCVSAATVWEIVIKQAIGKLDLPLEFQEVLVRQPFRFLAVTHEHAIRVGTLPMRHRDPFDRMLVAQSLVEGLTLVTRDEAIRRYDARLLIA